MGRKYNILKEELEKYYYGDKKTMKEISVIFGCSPMCIVSLMKKYGLKKITIEIPKEKLEDLYWKQNKSVRQCAKILGCGPSTINRAMRKYGLSRRPDNEFVDISKKELFDLYWNKKLNVQQIAKVIRCDAHTVCRKLKEFGIRVRTISENNSGENNHNYRKDLYDCEKLKDLYLNKNNSASKIAGYLNCSKPTILEKLRYFNIPIRENKEAIKLLDRKGSNNSAYIDGRTPLVQLIRGLSEYNFWRNQVLERDHYTCQECGDSTSYYLEVHHKVPFIIIFNNFLKEYDQFSPIEDKNILVRLATTYKSFWIIENGQTLCEYCHSLKRKETTSKIKNRENKND